MKVKIWISIFIYLCFFQINLANEKNEDLKSLFETNLVKAANLLDELVSSKEDSFVLNNLPKKQFSSNSFNVGEEITFSVKYGWINVGKAIFRVNKSLPINGRKTYMITSDAKTNGFFDAVYRVRDRITSYVDSEFLFSWKYIVIQREGNKKINEIIKYNYRDKIAVRYKSKFKKQKISHHKKEITLSKFVCDPFASLFYLRNLDFKVGDVIKIPVSSSDDIYEVKVKIIEKEKVSTCLGKLECYRISPMLLKEGIFINKGEMSIWITADKRKIPVKMKSAIAIGSITAKLSNYKEK